MPELDYPAEFLDLLVPGSRVRVFYSEGNVNNCIRHIRAVVDDQVVFRVWSVRKQTWRYHVEPLSWMSSTWKNGFLTGYHRSRRRGG